MRINLAGLMSIAAFLLPAPLLADDAVKCVQSQLNQLGYDAGTADGQIGKRTKSAGAAYIDAMQAKNPGWNMPPIDASNARLWCEKIAEAWPDVNDQWVALKYLTMAKPSDDNPAADPQPETTGTLVSNVVMDKGANFRVAVMQGGKPIWESETFGRDANNWAVPIPKEAFAKGDQVCYALEKGWVVLDASGKPFQVSCQPIIEKLKGILLQSTRMTYEMKIQKAEN